MVVAQERLEASVEQSPTYQAVHRFADVGPRKLRLFADLIRGKNVDEALQLLAFYPNRGAKLVRAVVQSAYGNAEDRECADPDGLVVSECRVDGAPTFKRIQPRARGTAFPIKRRMSHIIIVLRFPLDTDSDSGNIPRRRYRRNRLKDGEPREQLHDALPSDGLQTVGAYMENDKHLTIVRDRAAPIEARIEALAALVRNGCSDVHSVVQVALAEPTSDRRWCEVLLRVAEDVPFKQVGDRGAFSKALLVKVDQALRLEGTPDYDALAAGFRKFAIVAPPALVGTLSNYVIPGKPDLAQMAFDAIRVAYSKTAPITTPNLDQRVSEYLRQAYPTAVKGSAADFGHFSTAFCAALTLGLAETVDSLKPLLELGAGSWKLKFLSRRLREVQTEWGENESAQGQTRLKILTRCLDLIDKKSTVSSAPSSGRPPG